MFTSAVLPVDSACLSRKYFWKPKCVCVLPFLTCQEKNSASVSGYYLLYIKYHYEIMQVSIANLEMQELNFVLLIFIKYKVITPWLRFHRLGTSVTKAVLSSGWNTAFCFAKCWLDSGAFKHGRNGSIINLRIISSC